QRRLLRHGVRTEPLLPGAAGAVGALGRADVRADGGGHRLRQLPLAAGRFPLRPADGGRRGAADRRAGLRTVDVGTPAWVTALLMIPLGVGGSLAMPALTSLMLDSVAAERAGTAAALLNTSRQTGGALSIAVFGALLAGNFAPGMRESLLLAACLMAATALGAAALLPRGNQ